MSVDVEIRVSFSEEIVPSALLAGLIQTGWGLDLDGSLSILEPVSDGDADWEVVVGEDVSYLLQWAEGMDVLPGQFGFLVVHRPSEIGGVMIVDADRRSLMWGISVNIPRLFDERRLIDFSKCLEILWPALDSERFRVSEWSMHCR